MRTFRWRALSFGVAVMAAAACQPMPDSTPVEAADETRPARTFRDDVAFLERHMEIVTLGTADAGPRVAVAPRWQGRVMTSAADGESGIGYGWVNEALIETEVLQPHINAIGGEDRFWLGPEGGQFSIFFAGSDPVRSRSLADSTRHRHRALHGDDAR